MIRICMWLGIVVFFVGCSFFRQLAVAPTDAIDERDLGVPKVDIEKALGLQEKRKDVSYFYLLNEPRDAFASRIFLIDNAKERIDVQYYIYKEDTSGAFFTYHLLKAADRGVKVRILIDDLDTSGKDKSWLLGSLHPNIEVKVFNPITFRRTLRFAQLALHVDSLGRRMHNKALIVDGKYAIIGGRNIGDEYYATADQTLFLDFDVLCAGSVVPKIEEMFRIYWESRLSRLGQTVLEAEVSQVDLEQARRTLHGSVSEFLRSSIATSILSSNFVYALQNGSLRMQAAKAEFFYDLPQKINTDEEDTTYHISRKIDREFQKIKRSALIISPYFIPTEALLQKFRLLRKRGVEIVVITNSLASSDVFLVYSGYQKYIKALIETGVRLYEIKPHSFARLKTSKRWIRNNKVSLHTKLMVLDERYLAIGSANIDPRSIKLNTETFMIVDSKTLAQRLIEQARDVLISDDLIEVSWGKIPTPYSLKDVAAYGPIYKTTENGKSVIYYQPPYSGFWKIFGANVLSYFPIEGYL